MAANFLPTFSNAFSWMKIYEFRLRFHWSLFQMVLSTIFQHWLRWWLGADEATSHYLNQWGLIYRRIYASLGLNELRVKSKWEISGGSACPCGDSGVVSRWKGQMYILYYDSIIFKYIWRFNSIMIDSSLIKLENSAEQISNIFLLFISKCCPSLMAMYLQKWLSGVGQVKLINGKAGNFQIYLG